MIPSIKKSVTSLTHNKNILSFLKSGFSSQLPTLSFSHSNTNNQSDHQQTYYWKKSGFIMASALFAGLGIYYSDKVSMHEIEENQKGSTIVYLKDASDIHNLGLQGHVLVWYQTLDDPTIDSQVEQILKTFLKRRSETINIPFKIVIDKTQRVHDNVEQTNYYKKSCQLVVIKPDSIKPIELNRFLNYKGASIDENQYSILFNRISTEVNEVLEINLTNIRQFANDLSGKGTQAWILMAAHSPDPKDYRKSKKKFKEFVKEKQTFGQHVQKAMVTDQQTLRILGIDPSRARPSQVFILTPPSDNLPAETPTVSIFGNRYHVLTSWQISKFIFPPYLEKSHSDSLFLRVALDANQNISSQLKEVYKTLKELPQDSELKSLPKYLIYQKDPAEKGSSLTITLQKNNFDEIVTIYEKNSRHTDEEKRKLLMGSHKWKFPEGEELNASQLVNWFNRVKKGQEKEFFQSQNRVTEASDVPIYDFNSIRITGEEYFEKISSESKKPKVVFHFSPYCFSCKKFKHHFEALAKQKAQEYNFYRINNDENKSQKVQNFNSTPIFIVYKRNPFNNKLYSYQYKNTIFTKKVFSDFLDVTKDINFMDEGLFNDAITDRQKCEEIIKEFASEGGCSVN